VIEAEGATGVTFENLHVQYARGAGVKLNDCTGVVLSKCTISDNGMMGVNITGGSDCAVIDSEVSGNGDAGVVLMGGDRQTLTPSRHHVTRGNIHRNSRWIMNYAPNVFIGGVGNGVYDSDIHDSPQICVFMQGNDHTLHNSSIHDCVQQCSDCGAFYMGREWTYRGNNITQNNWHHLNSIFGGGQAIYLDDMGSSYYIADNVFNDVPTVLQLGGGRDNTFVRNYVNRSSNKPVHFDNRGQGWDKAGCRPGGLPYDFLGRVPYNDTQGAWGKYPHLAGIVSDDPCAPKYNVFKDNVMCNGATDLVNAMFPGNTAENNTVC
jgi:parallel beta-helix repeat protein